ncbi:MAG TPA: hypothetical protein VE593_11485 [Nitrososphaeraceae archaeon]|nr:hypothetical protein [Nitrososphaeraceae archaeon]
MLKITFPKEKRSIVYFVLIISIAFILSNISNGYYYYLQELRSNIFETLIQVIAIFSGFTVVVLFYYIQRIAEDKKEFIRVAIKT